MRTTNVFCRMTGKFHKGPNYTLAKLIYATSGSCSPSQVSSVYIKYQIIRNQGAFLSRQQDDFWNFPRSYNPSCDSCRCKRDVNIARLFLVPGSIIWDSSLGVSDARVFLLPYSRVFLDGVASPLSETAVPPRDLD